LRDADVEDAAFRERVARSREFARRGWRMAFLVCLGPALLGPIVLLLAGRTEAAAAAGAMGLALLGLPLAIAAAGKRRPT